MNTVDIKHCVRCDEDWCFYGTGRPIRCGKCKSPYWDRERSNNGEISLLGTNPVVSGIEFIECEPSALCSACEQDLVEVKGKLVCNDVSCGMFGQEQRGKK